jgi:hypothetical protein
VSVTGMRERLLAWRLMRTLSAARAETESHHRPLSRDAQAESESGSRWPLGSSRAEAEGPGRGRAVRVEAEWPSLLRVMRRAVVAPVGPYMLAVTLQRHVQLQLAIAAPLSIRTRVSAGNGSSRSNVGGLHLVAATLRAARTRGLAPEALPVNLVRSAPDSAWASSPVRARQTSSSGMILSPARWTEGGATRRRLAERTAAERWSAPRQLAIDALPRRFQARAAVDQTQTEIAFVGPPRILGRPATPARVSGPAPDLVTLAQIGARSWDDPAAQRPHNPMDEPTIERMTDQVLRTLDQRVVAARERLSRR